jgi:16S rRNA (cytidine1402-2'-O)-methyltransferase
MSGTLFLVSIPIGNDDDITFRALKVLKEADVIVYEEKKIGSKLLAHHEIHGKCCESLNEHNEVEMSDVILKYLLEGKNIALISDAGTPVFSDPGRVLVKKVIELGIKTIPIPGVSSLVSALVLSGFFIDEFAFCGFLSPKSDRRRTELLQLRNEQRVMVLMDTPYRLAGLVKDIANVFGHERQIAIGYNLTMPDEEVLRGWPDDLYQTIIKRQMKGEFVVVIDGKRNRSSNKNQIEGRENELKI